MRSFFKAAAVCLAVVPSGALLTGCSGDNGGPVSTPPRSTDGDQPELIGGRPAGPNDFRSTVAIANTCTAAKVGPHLFLTAAHCVAVDRPTRNMPPADDFPANEGVNDHYLAGQQILIDWGTRTIDHQSAKYTIVKTSIHPSWWTCPLCLEPILSPGGAADIAVVEISEATPQIPEAHVELGSIATGTQVIKVGWGCEQRTNVDPKTVVLERYKMVEASVIPVSEIRKYDSRLTDDEVSEVDRGYLVTPGHAQDPSNASLCLGDSGGPLYLPGASDRHIVGVNADYTFKPPKDETDLGGVSWTDWHTRTSLDSLHGVGQWLKDLGANTVDSR